MLNFLLFFLLCSYLESVCSFRGLFISSLEWVQTSHCLKVILSPLLGWYPLGILTDVHVLWSLLHFGLWTQVILSLVWILAYFSPLVLFLPSRGFLLFTCMPVVVRDSGNPSADLFLSLSAASSLLLCITNSNCLGLPGF